MKKLIGLPLFLCLHFFLHAQHSTTYRTLASFDKISISGGFDLLVLKEGDKEGIEISANGVNPEKIVTEVEGNTLRIEMKRGSYYNMKAKLTLTYRSLKSIASSGSTDIETIGAIKADRFEMASSGSGDFRGELDVKSLDIAISGSADYSLQGNADDQDYAISGSGDINASRLSGQTAAVAISGSGDVKLNVKGRVKTSVSGSGEVTNND